MKVSAPSHAPVRLDVRPAERDAFAVTIHFPTLGEALAFARQFDVSPHEVQQRRASTRTRLVRLTRELLHRRADRHTVLATVHGMNSTMYEPLPRHEVEPLVLTVLQRHLDQAAARRGGRS